MVAEQAETTEMTKDEALSKMALRYLPPIYKKVLYILADEGPMTKTQLQVKSGAAFKSVELALYRLHKAGVVRIADWARGQRAPQGVWEIGAAASASRPARRSAQGVSPQQQQRAAKALYSMSLAGLAGV